MRAPTITSDRETPAARLAHVMVGDESQRHFSVIRGARKFLIITAGDPQDLDVLEHVLKGAGLSLRSIAPDEAVSMYQQHSDTTNGGAF